MFYLFFSAIPRDSYHFHRFVMDSYEYHNHPKEWKNCSSDILKIQKLIHILFSKEKEQQRYVIRLNYIIPKSLSKTSVIPDKKTIA